MIRSGKALAKKVSSNFEGRFCEFLKGTRGFRNKSGIGIEREGKEKMGPTTTNTSTTPTSDKSTLKEMIENKLENLDKSDKTLKDKTLSSQEQEQEQDKEQVAQIFETFEVSDEDLNTIEKESLSKDKGRSFKSGGLGRSEGKSKEYPHGYDKI